MIIQAAVTKNDFLKKPTSYTNEAMALNFFTHYPIIRSLVF